MVLDRYRGRVDPLLTRVASSMARIGPNALSAAAFLCAVAVMVVLFFIADSIALIIAFVLVTLNGFFDALDGKVARITGKSSTKGDLVDHVMDRYADFFIIGGLAFSAFANLGLGLIALFSVIMASYMGTQSQALRLERDYGGLLGRADRIVLLMIFVLAQYLLMQFHPGFFEISSGVSISLIDIMLIVFIVAGNITAMQRLSRMWRALGS